MPLFIIGWCFAGVTHSWTLYKRIARLKCPPQSNATGEIVEHTFPVNVSYPVASDVLHPTMRHPHLHGQTERCTVTWTDILRTVYHSCVHAHSLNVRVEKVLKNSGTEGNGNAGAEASLKTKMTGSSSEASGGTLNQKKRVQSLWHYGSISASWGVQKMPLWNVAIDLKKYSTDFTTDFICFWFACFQGLIYNWSLYSHYSTEIQWTVQLNPVLLNLQSRPLYVASH